MLERLSMGGVLEQSLFISVADPDPDRVFCGHPDPYPGKYRIGSRSGSFIHKKTLVIQIFSLYEIV